MESSLLASLREVQQGGEVEVPPLDMARSLLSFVHPLLYVTFSLIFILTLFHFSIFILSFSLLLFLLHLSYSGDHLMSWALLLVEAHEVARSHAGKSG